jgi:ectoine hydroxylase-related dioxygenase (phytanoyl-CoA dioxygenase family)
MGTVRVAFRDRDLQRRFDAAGFAIVPCLDAARVARLRDVYERADAEVLEYPFSASLMSDQVAFRDLVNEALFEAFAEPIAEMLVDYRISFGQFFTKRAGTAFTLPLHQDPTFLDETRFTSLNFWVPLVDVTPENSCLRVVPGSHKLNAQLRGQRPRFPYPDLVDVIEERYLFDCTMPAGHACIMTAALIHGSHANPTSAHRMAASVVAVPVESTPWYVYQPVEYGPFEVYAVDETFHRTHQWAAPPPDTLQPSAVLPYAVDPVDEAALQRVYAEATQTGLAVA